jgi:Holliday junction resolvase RusA-like endonuclease
MNVRIEIKPLSVNRCWQGRRFATKEYKSYTQELLYKLPKLPTPSPPYRASIYFGLSNMANDIDNSVKPLIDIFQKKYGFNDKHIMELHVYKIIIPKGKEYFEFNLTTIP